RLKKKPLVAVRRNQNAGYGTTSSLTVFFDYLNTLRFNIKFTMDTEKDGVLPFMDAIVKRTNNKKQTHGVYWKKTHTDHYLFFPFRSRPCTIVHRAETICADESRPEELKQIKEALMRNREDGYPLSNAWRLGIPRTSDLECHGQPSSTDVQPNMAEPIPTGLKVKLLYVKSFLVDDGCQSPLDASSHSRKNFCRDFTIAANDSIPQNILLPHTRMAYYCVYAGPGALAGSVRDLHEPEFFLPAQGLKTSDDLRNLAWDEKNLSLPPNDFAVLSWAIGSQYTYTIPNKNLIAHTAHTVQIKNRNVFYEYIMHYDLQILAQKTFDMAKNNSTT
ncbi:hypothetical protein NQ318_000299, partial [Aromia moschata]